MYVEVALHFRIKIGLTLARIKTAIDPTRLTKGRKFAPTNNPNAGSTDTTLWTETPAERQQRLTDELSGKKRRKENSDVPDDGGREALEARKRQKTEQEIQKAVSEHNVRGSVVSPLFSLADLDCRGKIVQNHCYRCTRRTRKLRNQSRRRTIRYGTIRGTWPCLDVCWMRNRGKKSLRNLLGCQTDLDPVSSPECVPSIRAKCKSHSTRASVVSFHPTVRAVRSF
jgi:hypothetical protein